MILLTCINPRLKWIYALGSHIGVKMTIFGIIPKVKPRWNISWECSIPLNPPIFIIYRIKLILLTCINPRLKWICALGSHIGVKMTIFGITPKVKPGRNISWECSIALKPISLFLWVNKEGLCHGIRVWVHLIWIISFFMILEWMKKRN